MQRQVLRQEGKRYVTQVDVTIAMEGAGADAGDGPGAAGLCGLDEETLRRVVALTLARVGVAEPVALSVLVTDDEALRTLNRAYRGRDDVTDVLSFPLLDAPLVDAPADQLWSVSDEPLQEPLEEDGNEEWDRDPAADPVVVSYDNERRTPAPDDDNRTSDAAAAPFRFETPPDLARHLGDIVIARGATERQAAAADHRAGWELAYLLAHGVLHLVGYDDHTDAGYAAMVAHQEAVLQEAGILP